MTVPPQNPQGAPGPYQPPVTPGGYGLPPGQPDPYGQPPVQPDPYGQAPGQPNPYGSPAGQPNPYAQPVYGQAPMGYGPPPMPLPQKKRRLWLKIGLPILVVILLGIGAIFFVGLKAVNDSALGGTVGDCLNLKDVGETVSTLPAKADCASLSANFKIALKLDGSQQCPGNNVYGEFSTERPSERLCLELNAKAGDCLFLSADEKNLTKVLCTDPTANASVTKVAAGIADATQCDNPEASAVYPQPPNTFCFGPVK
jgi:hypothetical protein